MRYLIVILLALCLLSKNAFSDDTEPIFLPGEIVARIPLSSGKDPAVYYAPDTSPFLATNGAVWDARTGEKVSDIPFPKELIGRSLTVSRDGTHLACMHAADKSKKLVTIHAWNCRTGESAGEYTTAWGSGGFLRFAGPNRLVFCGQSKLVICDLSAKHIEREVSHSVSYVGMATVSHKGRYLALGMDEDILIYDLNTARPVAKLEEPEPGEGRGGMIDVSALTFSPDSQELAAIVDWRVVVWSNTGKIISDQKIPHYNESSLRSKRLSWLLDKRGWLINGRLLLERNTSMPLWLLHPADTHLDLTARLLDQNHIMLQIEHADNTHELMTTSIPWPRIRKAIAAIETGDLLLHPGGAITVDVQVGEVRIASKEQVAGAITERIQSRLETRSVRVEDNQPVRLEVNYSESEGEELRIVEQRDRFDRRGRDTGRTVRDTRARLSMRLTAEGYDQPLWEHTATRSATNATMDEAISEASVREHVYRGLSSRVVDFPLPRFIPKNPTAEVLPIETYLGK